jgi:hypothetical protein
MPDAIEMKIRSLLAGPRILLAVLCLLYSCFFTWNRLANAREWPPASFERLARGEAMTPMQYRILVPMIARGAVKLADRVPGLSTIGGLGAIRFANQMDRVKFALEFAGILGLLVVFSIASRWTAEDLLEEASSGTVRRLFRWGSLFLLMLALPFHYLWKRTDYSYPYDIPSITFMVAGIALIVRRNWMVFYPVFVLATLNRETSCFLVVAMVLAERRRMPARTLACHVVLQSCLWGAVKAVLWLAFRANTNSAYCNVAGLFKNSIGFNLHALLKPTSYVMLAAVYGYLWIPLLVMWRDIASRRLVALLWLVPIVHVAMLIPGEIVEIRIYAEMLPLVIWGVMAGLLGRLTVRRSERERGLAVTS